MDFALGQFDLMEKIGKEVEIVRETAKNKATFSKVIDDVNNLHSVINRYHDADFTQSDASIHPLFISIYCRELDGYDDHPFITMYQLPDDDRPDDYFGGITCSHHIEED